MVEEIRKQKVGRSVNEKRYQQILNDSRPSQTPWADQLHESLTPAWWLAEFVPKKRRGKWLPRINLFRPRDLRSGALIHETALRRIREELLRYLPRNLTEEFLKGVRELPEEQMCAALEYRP